MHESIESSRELLSRWCAGDVAALGPLLERESAWVQRYARHRLGPLLRAQHETGDVLQQVMLAALRYRPPGGMTERQQFRALLARLIENVLRAEFDHCTAQRRDRRRERAWTDGDSGGPREEPAAASGSTPSRVVARREDSATLHLAIELLEPLDREILLLREFHGLSFAAIGAHLGIHEKAAQRAFHRALPKLATRYRTLLADSAFGARPAEV